MSQNYAEYYYRIQHLMTNLGKELSAPMTGFAQLHRSAVAEGALSTKIKELIALAIAITVRCDGCISFHVHDALAAGATRQEIVEAIGVAILMGGGPSVVYGSEALEALDSLAALEKFEQQEEG
jgi:AhpD family alkylhydroperoxidase